ncbi:MAG: metal ABC transporter permease [Rhodospirillales bacterium]|nr:metal ABC transporter permease [Rhodospirillales bacterium]
MLGFDFMRHAFLASGIVAVLAGAIGYVLVLRGQAFAAHALAHVGFAGAAGAVLLGVSPFAGMLIAAFAGAGLMGALGERMAERDIAIGVVLAFALGLGLLFLHFFTGSAAQATALLFGNVLAVGGATLRLLAVVSALTLAILAAIARPLLFATLQPDLAEARGVGLRGLGVVFLLLLAMASAAAAEIVGVLLVFALMVGPAAAAERLCRSISAGIALSVGLALAAAWAGLTLAFYTDWPASFWISALASGFYLAALGIARLKR